MTRLPGEDGDSADSRRFFIIYFLIREIRGPIFFIIFVCFVVDNYFDFPETSGRYAIVAKNFVILVPLRGVIQNESSCIL